MSSTDDELKLVQLQRERLRLADEMERRARRAQVLDLTRSVGAFTRGSVSKGVTALVNLGTFALVVACCVGLAAAVLATTNGMRLTEGFLGRFGYYLGYHLEYIVGGSFAFVALIFVAVLVSNRR